MLGFGLPNRGARIRTGDPLLPKQVRYRTAPRPEVLLLQRFSNFAKSAIFQTASKTVSKPVRKPYTSYQTRLFFHCPWTVRSLRRAELRIAEACAGENGSCPGRVKCAKDCAKNCVVIGLETLYFLPKKTMCGAN